MEEKYKIHAFYILFILIAIIIVLVTVKWTDIPKLVDYITFALSVTSLVVGVLAIAYGVYSTSAFSQSSSALITASHEISQNSIELTRTTNELARKVETLPEMILTVGEQIETTQVMLKGFGEKPAPQLITNVGDIIPVEITPNAGALGIRSTAPILTDTTPADTTSNVALLTTFLKRSSIIGLLILYACLMSLSKSKPFSIDDLSEVTTLPSKYTLGVAKYWMGYIVASRASGMLSCEMEKSIVTVSQLDEYLKKNILIALEDKITKAEDTTKRLFDEQKVKIEKYFG